MRALVLLFAFAAAPVLAAERWERFFELSFGDLRAEAAEAKKAGAIYDSAEFMLLGEYVAGGGYRNASFAVYKQSRQKRGS